MPSEADIPEVEREIRPVGALIAGHYEAPVRAAADEFADEIEARDLEESNAEGIALLVAALILLMRRNVERAPVGPGRRSRVRAAAQRLIEQGGEAVGGFRRIRPRGPTVARVVRDMESAVWAESRWRIESNTVEERAKKAIRKAQAALLEETRERARREQEEADRAAREREDSARQERRNPRSGQGQAKSRSRGATGQNGDSRPIRPTRRAPGPLPESVRRELIRDLVGAAWVGQRQIHDVLADAWAYRVYNVGRYLAMRDQSVREFVAYNNPPRGPDSRTTPFCRSIHRRTVKVERIEKSLGDYLEAVRANDRSLAFRSFPLSTLAKVQSAADFKNVRGLAGLPPYHYRCRTIIADARVARLGIGDISRRVSAR